MAEQAQEFSGLVRVARFLTEPHAEIRGIESRRSATVLSVLVLVMLAGLCTLDVWQYISQADISVPRVGYGFLIFSYAFSRTRFVATGAAILVAMFPVEVLLDLYDPGAQDPASSLYYLPLGLLVSALFFPSRVVLFVALSQVLLIHGVPFLGMPDLWTYSQISGPTVALILTSILLLLLLYHRGAIEEQRQLELEDSSSRLEIALTVGMTATWDWDLETGQIQWSEGASAMFNEGIGGVGTTFDEFVRFVHPQDRSSLRGSVAYLREGKLPIRPIEFRVVWKSGEVRWLSSIGRVMQNAAGKPSRLLGILSDVTDRVMAKRALERQVLELRALSSIGFVCNEAATMDELISRVTDIVGSTLYPDNFGVLLVNKAREMLEHHPSFRVTSDALLRDIALSAGVCGWVATNNQPRRLGDTSGDPIYISLARDMHSEICVPVRVGDEVIAVIDAESSRPNAFSDDDERLLMTIASEISVAYKRIGAESELREKKELLARTQELAHLGTWEWDLPTNKTIWSDQLARILGEPAGGVFPFELDRVHVEDRAMVEAALRNALQTGVIPQLEVRIRRPDGHVRTLLGQGSVLRDGRGIPVRVVGTALDISEVRQAEDKFVKAFRTIHDAMAILKVSTSEFVEVNEGFTRLSGFTRAEAIGKTPASLGMWKQSEDDQRFRASLSGQDGVANFDVELFDKDRNIHSCLISAELIEMDGQQMAVTITRDITDRKQLEERLLQSQKLESIGRLAGGVAHDFNNYLSAIMGYADLAEKKAGDERMKSYLSNIRTASEKASHLTRQLLAFARKQIITPRIVSLAAVIEDGEKMLRRLIGEDTELLFRVRHDFPKVKIDPNQFEQVLINLVVNAHDSMASGGRITIAMSIMELASGHPRRRPEMSAGEYVSMTIADTGHGIPAELQKLIFEPFYTTKEQGKGTGLGLPTCLGIMEQNGGTIYVESSTNKGTTFRLLLPAIHTEFADEAAQIDVRMPRGTETILFAEDEHMVRDIGVETLRELGYKVHPAANGPEALLFATTFKGTIDILVTDVVMPQMSGRELAEHVQKIRPRIKLLYTSGYTESIISQHGVLDSGVMLLQKPYSPSMLATRVRDILDGNESSDA